MRIRSLLPALVILSGIEAHASAQNIYQVHIDQPDPLPAPSICMVMTDPETEKNMVIWEKNPDLFIGQYQVLKTSGAEYTMVSESIVTDSSVMIDWNSKPGTKTDAYVLVSIDTCGNVTEKSSWHKPFFLQSSIGLNDVVNLNWQPYLVDGEEYIFKSIVIFRGTDSTKLLPIDTISAGIGSTTYTDERPPLNVNVYYRIAGERESACDPFNLAGKKASKGPFVHSLSNLEDNRLQTTAVSFNNAAGPLEIFPNPMGSSARIAWKNSGESDCILFIYDLGGSLVRTVNAGNNIQEIFLERGKLESGCYIIELRGSKTAFGRLMVN